MNNEQLQFLEPILKTFENEDIKEFTLEIVSSFPQYIWEVGASSTGKYHPRYTLGKTGLMKHQIAVARFLNFFFELEQYNTKFSSRERDLLRLAALIHDGLKSGTQEDYKRNKYTKFNHPLLMATHVLSYKDKWLSLDELKYIATAISRHMGQWNTDKRSEITLPKPDSEASQLLHLADYLASRKPLNMSFEEYEALGEGVKSKPTLETFKMPFGKYTGYLLTDIPDNYILWLSEQMISEPLKGLVEQVKFIKQNTENN